MKPCYYCHNEVYQDEPGWGWGDDLDKMTYFVFHLECLEVCEGVVLA